MRTGETGTHQSSPASPRERLIGLVRQVLGPSAGCRPLSIDARLSELGLSSIKMVGLMLAIEAEFDLTIPQEEITPESFHSIVSIETMLERIASGPAGQK